LVSPGSFGSYGAAGDVAFVIASSSASMPRPCADEIGYGAPSPS
jgi:hypothetical protein